MENSIQDKNNKKKTGWRRNLWVSLAILVTAGVITTVIFLTEPVAEKEGGMVETAMLVQVTTPEKGDFRPVIIATGVVRPERDIHLSPRVSGEVTGISDQFDPGGYVSKGQVLLKIDPSDYENHLQMRKSELLQAEADFEMEMGRQEVAKLESRFVDDSISAQNRALLLREPQLNAAKARVASARAAHQRAELDLERTVLRAPFDAHVLSRNVHTGSQVSPGVLLGRLVGTETYWVEATLPLSRIKWLTIPGDTGSRGSEVTIMSRTSWGANETRTGQIYKLIGALDEETRLARVLIAVDDPLARKPENRGKRTLIIGSFVEARLQADLLTNITRIDRALLRTDNKIWIYDAGKLRIRDVNVILQDATHAYIDKGLTENDSIVVTNLSTVVDGERLRVADQQTMLNDTINGMETTSRMNNQ